MSVSWLRTLVRPPLPSGWWHARWFWRLTASDLAWRISGGRVGVRWIRPVWSEDVGPLHYSDEPRYLDEEQTP